MRKAGAMGKGYLAGGEALPKAASATALRMVRYFLPGVLFLGASAIAASSERSRAVKFAESPRAVAPLPNACRRFAEGEQIKDPAVLHSVGGILSVALSFQTRTDAQGRTLYCFMTPSGLENPTLRARPGDRLIITVTNNTPRGSGLMTIDPPNCGATQMSTSSVNLHFHGTNTLPGCHGDEVIKTIINSGNTFRYEIRFPRDEPPGLYWYHPHIHGISDGLVMGGATGAIVIEGIESLQPAVAGLPQRVILLRDQAALSGPNEGPGGCADGVPFRDLTVNQVPINSYLQPQGKVDFVPAKLEVPAKQTEFWRVGNLSADTIADLRLIYDGIPQTLGLVAIDGVPVNSQDGQLPGAVIPISHFRLPPASRVEFIVTTPADSGGSAQLVTTSIDTGPAGDCDPNRPLIEISATGAAPLEAATVPVHRLPPGAGRRFKGLPGAKVGARRVLFFDENNSISNPQFYMTLQGQRNRVFDPNQRPSIVTTQGAVEQWTVENRTRETHEFHIHQIHFLVQNQNHFGTKPHAPAVTGQYLDMIEVPAWDGVSPNYPSVALLMDFRGAVVGKFVFHCHILNHEDLGMMNVIQVLPRARTSARKHSPRASRLARRSTHRS
jgi:FtsP/CotA-like multicopper oxidase with cupredoxin domain